MGNDIQHIKHGEVLKALMSESSRSANEVSLSIGANRAYVSNTAARDNVMVDTLALIASAYGYDLALINRDTNETRYIIEPPK